MAEDITENEVSKKETRKENRILRSFTDVISGNILTREQTLKFLPYFMFLSIMAIIYIANGYYAEAKIRRLNTLTEQLKELRSEYITTKSDLMFISKQSEVAAAAAAIGLKESLEPPQKIVIRKNQKPFTEKK